MDNNKNQVSGVSGRRLVTETGPKRIVIIDDINMLLRSVFVPMRLDVIPQRDIKGLAEWIEWMKMEDVEVENYIKDEAVVEMFREIDIDLPGRSDNYSWQLGDLIIYATLREYHKTRELEIYLIDVL
jgi:hypothetical protein